jgi:hypothetical protein
MDLDRPDVRGLMVPHVGAALFHSEVLTPDCSSTPQAAVNDATLLLADLVRSRRMSDRAWLLDPFASPSVCDACDEAYRAAHYVLAEAGGVEEWLRRFELAAAAGRGAP